MIERTCLNCGGKFEVPYPSSKRVNCKEECRIARLRQPGRKRRADSGTRKTEWVALTCAECGKAFERPPWRVRHTEKLGRAHYCSKECSSDRQERRFKEGPQKGQRPVGRRLRGEGRHINNQGYVMAYVPPGERPPGGERVSYHPEHRIVLARQLGRWLEPHETTHHINGDKTDNRPENLQLRNGSHGRGHVLRCRSCGSSDIEHLEL